MSRFEVTLKDRTVEVIEGADAYQQEGQMTTFFATGEGRHVVDCWSTRLASFRTSEVVIIRRVANDVLREQAAAADLRREWDEAAWDDAPLDPPPLVSATDLPSGGAARRLRTA